MGLLHFIKWLFAPKPIKRDVSQLQGEEGDAPDQVEEVIDTSGGPLKEHHRRRALRDRRLLPKPKPKTPSFSYNRPKRKKYLEKQEADRLFSPTMRNRDRKIRDLLSDDEQLRRLGLPLWRNEADLAAALEISVSMLRHFSIHRQRETVSHYIAFSIPKRSGGRRIIMAPKRRLKAIQRKLNELLVSKLPVSADAHGFRAKRSVLSNARPHVGKQIVIRLDLKDFFPSVHVGRVRGMLVAYGYSYPVATTLAVLMTESERQPVDVEGKVYQTPVGKRHCVQGAPTSPGLCNAILLRLDRRLAGLGRRYNFTYTRYADDLTFSGEDSSAIKNVISLARRIIREEGFEANKDKTRVARQGRRQVVTGVTVNKTLGLSRKERRKLRAAIHQARSANNGLSPQLRGKLAYLQMLNPAQAQALLKTADRTA